jgi:hypothetical protein
VADSVLIFVSAIVVLAKALSFQARELVHRCFVIGDWSEPTPATLLVVRPTDAQCIRRLQREAFRVPAVLFDSACSGRGLALCA